MATADVTAFADNIKTLGDSIVKLTVMEAKALGDYLETVHGIKAAARNGATADRSLEYQLLAGTYTVASCGSGCGKWIRAGSDLMRVLHPQVAGVAEVSAARADALREHVLGLVRVLVPGQERWRQGEPDDRAADGSELHLPVRADADPGEGYVHEHRAHRHDQQRGRQPGQRLQVLL